MDLTDDQHKLFDDLRLRLDQCPAPDGLIRVMGDMLRSLLRRRGDAQFLVMVQDLFVTGLDGLTWPEHKILAVEVVKLVITKRPEIALAWQRLQAAPGPDAGAMPADGDGPDHRRQSDHAPDPDGLPDLSLLDQDFAYMFQDDGADVPSLLPTPDDLVAPDAPAYDFDHAERQVILYVADVLDRRLSIFAGVDTGFPSPAYCHEQPFFLFTPVFAKVTRRFLARVLLPLMRDPLERHVYRHVQPAMLADDKALQAFLAEKRPEIWKIVIERLGKLAAHHRTAEAKLVAAQAQSGGPEFQVVEVPVRRPKVVRVLGVPLTLGTVTQTSRKKVRVRPSTVPDSDELRALGLIAQYRDLAAQAGLEVPNECDFAFLRTLFEFDARKYAQTLDELGKLATHKETTRAYLLDRIRGVDETYATHLADAMAISLFYRGVGASGGQFGFQGLYDICMGSARSASSLASKRPFLPGEVGRRPRELAFQIRECLKRRAERTQLGIAIAHLFEVWKIMGRTRFQAEMDAALTVFSAFPVVFAGDPAESSLSSIGITLQHALSAPTPDAARTIDAVLKLYANLR